MTSVFANLLRSCTELNTVHRRDLQKNTLVSSLCILRHVFKGADLLNMAFEKQGLPDFLP